ncbi:MAG: topoisomerase DNA-binding C4 zinc finger domain-containing protein, partial [Chloroflexota bacterium]
TAEPIPLKDVGTCPEWGGEVVRRRTKKKRTFLGCANYPKCSFTTFGSPLPQACPKCGSLVVAKGRDQNRGECLKCQETVTLGAIPEPAGVAG